MTELCTFSQKFIGKPFVSNKIYFRNYLFKMSKLILLHLVIFLIGAFAGKLDDPELLIVTNSGPVQGFWQTPFFNESSEYCTWLGIPYAQKPLDNLRFKVNF